MEVHHHPHVEKKSFKEYLLEGLMIFLAVSMGFIAENIREYYTDKERELQYIEAFVRDLKADTTSMNFAIRSNLVKEKMFDSLLIVSNSDLTVNANAKQFIKFFMKGAFMPTHSPSAISVTQLKSTGSFRLIHNRNGVIDSILKYDKFNEVIIGHNDYYRENMNGVWDSFYPIADIKIFRDTSFAIYLPNNRQLTEKQTPPLHLSQEKLSLFTGFLTRNLLFNQTNRGYLEQQLKRAKRMLQFFEKEYHLENQ